MAKGLWIILAIIAVLAIGGAILFMQKQNLNNQQGNTQNSQSNNPSEISNTNNVEIKSFAFSPLTLTIKKGDIITWTNKDLVPHTITSDSGDELDSGTISNGKEYSHTFNTAGTFSYHCSIHPSMKGEIIVE